MGAAVVPGATKVVDVRIEDNYFEGPQGRGSRATLSQEVTEATKATFDFCDHLTFPQIANAKVSVMAESGFPRAIARPTKDCKVTVETDLAMTGTITVDVDSSEYAGHFV